MPKQKTKAPRKELGGAKVTQIQSEVERFQQKWGMELTAQETSKVVDRATANISNAESEIKVRPAVRNQMFAMLIEKSPAKAISMRMEMYEKRGKPVTSAQKTRVRAVAKEKGFRAARMELNSIVKVTKPKKKEEMKRSGAEGVARKKRPARIRMPVKKDKIARTRVTSGASVQEVLEKAKVANNNIRKIWDGHNKEMAEINKKYEKNLMSSGTSGSVKQKTERMQEALNRNPEYKREVAQLEKKTLVKLKVQKDKRDMLLKTALGGMGMKGAALTTVHNKITNAREQMGVYRPIKSKNFVRVDLSSGVLENQQFVNGGIQSLKKRAKKMEHTS